MLNRNVVWCGVLLVAMVIPSLGQSPPTDLTNLDLEKILALHIRRADAPSETARPLRFSYRVVYARYDGNRDGTDDVVWDCPGGETRTSDNFPVVPLVINQQAHPEPPADHLGPDPGADLGEHVRRRSPFSGAFGDVTGCCCQGHRRGTLQGQSHAQRQTTRCPAWAH